MKQKMYRTIIIIAIILLAIFLVSRTNKVSNSSRNIYYLETEPVQVDVAKALTFLKNNPQLYGNNIMNDVNIIPTTEDKFIQQLQLDYNSGLRSVITLFGTEILSKSFDWLKAHPDFTMLNLFSTANIDKPSNLVRFAVNDVEMLKILVRTIPKNTIVFYDDKDLWANTTSKMLEDQGFDRTSTPPSSGNTILIVAGKTTSTFVDQVPSTTTKLYGLDGSCFFPLVGDSAVKASNLNFECLTYEPIVVSSLFDNFNVNYLLPLTFDALKYQQLLENGVSQDVIQKSNVGYTGGFEMKNNDRIYGDFAWYQFNDGKWNLVRKVLVDPKGTCEINV